MPDQTMDGVTDQAVTVPVSATQYARLEKDRILPDRPRVTHKLQVGPFYLPGVWVVVRTERQMTSGDEVYLVTLAKLEKGWAPGRPEGS